MLSPLKRGVGVCKNKKMEQETTASKVIGLSLVGIGLYIAAKNYKKEGFWMAVLATSLVFGTIGVKIYKKQGE